MPTLDWLNRDAAFATTAQVPTRVLRPHRAAPPAVGDDAAGNLLISKAIASKGGLGVIENGSSINVVSNRRS